MASSKTGAKAGAAKRTTTRSTSVKKGSAKKPVAKTATTKTTVRTNTKAPAVTAAVQAENPTNFPAIILAEVVGTFTLTLVALASMQQAGSLYIGLTLAVMVLAVGAVSGSHINPAVTFGLWAARKIKTAIVPVYWVAQIVGAILAILLLGLLSGNGYPLSFEGFADVSWGVLGAEAIGAAVLLFGFTAVLANNTLSGTAKALGIGFSLTLALVVSTTALTTVQSAKIDQYQQAANEAQDEDLEYPSEVYIKNTTVNPAVALAATGYTDAELSGMQAGSDEAKNSRFDLNTIVGTLIGAAIGSNLYLLVAYANRQSKL